MLTIEHGVCCGDLGTIRDQLGNGRRERGVCCTTCSPAKLSVGRALADSDQEAFRHESGKCAELRGPLAELTPMVSWSHWGLSNVSSA